FKGPNSRQFGQTNDCPVSLAGGATCTINVTFSPLGVGTETANLQVGGGGATELVAVSGLGTFVNLTPTSIDFGSQAVGTISQSVLIWVTNVGSSTVNIFDITIGGPNSTDFIQTNSCGSSLPAGGICSIVVNFIPTITGPRSAMVMVND